MSKRLIYINCWWVPITNRLCSWCFAGKEYLVFEKYLKALLFHSPISLKAIFWVTTIYYKIYSPYIEKYPEFSVVKVMSYPLVPPSEICSRALHSGLLYLQSLKSWLCFVIQLLCIVCFHILDYNKSQLVLFLIKIKKLARRYGIFCILHL